MNKLVINFIRYATDNNEVGIAKEMFEEKVTVREGESLRARLYKVFLKDKAKFIRIMRRAGFNEGTENYTTQPNTYVAMAQSVAERKAGGKPVAEVSRETVDGSTARGWWNDVLDTMVGGSESETTTTGTTTKPATGAQTTIIIVSIAAIGGIGALIYFLTR